MSSPCRRAYARFRIDGLGPPGLLRRGHDLGRPGADLRHPERLVRDDHGRVGRTPAKRKKSLIVRMGRPSGNSTPSSGTQVSS